MDQLVGDDARDLLCEAGGGVDAIDIGEGEVDFLVITVQFGLGFVAVPIVISVALYRGKGILG